MSLTRITDLNIERFELNASPRRNFSSSSVSGVTGSVALFADNSSAIADVLTTNSAGSFFNDETIESARAGASLALSSGSALHDGRRLRRRGRNRERRLRYLREGRVRGER